MIQQIFNLIILDESGSMSSITQQTIDGCNETINTIKVAQEQFAETQEHFVSIYAFQSGGRVTSRYLMKNMPPATVKHITNDDYDPRGGTPLHDAVGSCLVDLKATTRGDANAIGSVTIITDGCENTSREFSGDRIAEMIQELKELGWNFNFIGANIDVVRTARRYNIDNHLEFRQDDEGTREMFRRERDSKMSYLRRMEAEKACCAPGQLDERTIRDINRRAAQGYYEQDERPKFTPERIRQLKPDEIFVFGSNLRGKHNGGASLVAWRRFGAVQGQAVGLQGQSYAIPTVRGNVAAVRPYVDEFLEFARNNQNLTFYVTRVGCGLAGFTEEEMAPLFAEALSMTNVILPEPFVNVLKGASKNYL